MKKNTPFKYREFIIPIIIGIFNVLIILFPVDIISAAREGLRLWFDNVLPSLLPFVIFTNILTGCGAITFLGSLLEPVMRPLFGVPGAGGVALATGMASGYPMGAKVVAQLRADDILTRIQAQRLMAFCNNSGPLFILGAVGVSMFGSAKLGYFIMAVHYISAIVTGLIFKYYGPQETNFVPPTRRIGRRGFGQILGESVKNAMETMAIIGGYIILFCVVVKILEITQITAFTEIFLRDALNYFGIDSETYKGFLVGLMEITNGSRILSAADFSKAQIMSVCGIITFGGFCIHAQTISFIGMTDIKASVYILSKALQAIIAMATASLLFPLVIFTDETAAVPVFLMRESVLIKLVFSALSYCVLIVVLLSIGLMGFKRR